MNKNNNRPSKSDTDRLSKSDTDSLYDISSLPLDLLQPQTRPVPLPRRSSSYLLQPQPQPRPVPLPRRHLSETNRDLKTRLQLLQEENITLLTQNQTLQRLLSEMKAENQRLIAKNNRLISQKKGIKSDISQQQNTQINADAKRLLSEMKAENQRLIAKNIDANAQLQPILNDLTTQMETVLHQHRVTHGNVLKRLMKDQYKVIVKAKPSNGDIIFSVSSAKPIGETLLTGIQETVKGIPQRTQTIGRLDAQICIPKQDLQQMISNISDLSKDESWGTRLKQRAISVLRGR